MKKKFNVLMSIAIILLVSITPIVAQPENKVALVTVSGSGKTKDEAIQVALRNAIEQAFGTFISSNTEILNDELVKDEIVSVTNGNIQEFDIISEVQTPDGNWSNTVKAKVAIDKLTSFCENKGVKVEFKGSLFAINIKQQMLNEQNELKAIENMRLVLKKIICQSFDFNISAGQPSSSGDLWKIPITIEGTLNNNFKNVSVYLFNTLKGLGCNQSEFENYTNLNKELYFVAYKPMGAKDKDAGLFALRNKESFEQVIMLINDIRDAFINISINNGIETINLNKLRFLNGESGLFLEDLQTKHRIGTGETYNGREKTNESILEIIIKSIYFIPVAGEDLNTPYNWPVRWNPARTADYFFLNRNEKHFGGIIINGHYDDIYIKQNFKFIYGHDFLPSLRTKYGYFIDTKILVISFDNLKVGISKGIISYDNIYDISNIQKISNFSVAPNNY